MRQTSPLLTLREFEIMRVVWNLECGATVRAVHHQLSRTRQIALTSVLTRMKILEKKGHLRRSPCGTASVYYATRPRRESLQRMLAVFVANFFEGSVEELLNHLPNQRCDL
jgi:predicted transcriptional regulator